MWSKVVPKLQNATRSSSSGPPFRLLRNYEKFQKDDGVPVYLKGGPMDKVLFGLTVGLCVYGLADGLYTIFQMARPKKSKK